MKKVAPLFLILILSCSGNSSSRETLPENDKEIVCFIYHRFGDNRYPSTNVAVNDFEAHLRYLSDKNFQVLTLTDAIDYLASGSPTKKTAVITIDDAFKSFYEKGLPLLKKYKMPATLFINTKTIGGADYMNWSQIKESMQSNIEVGNHTHTHDYFLNDPIDSRYKKFEEDIKQCQSIIKKNLNISPLVFAYPYGEFDDEMKKIVMKAGFKGAAAQNSGVLYSGTDLFQIPRFPMAELYSEPKKFAEKASMRPIKVIHQNPVHTLLSNEVKRPVLQLTINTTDLQTNQLQCFVQGGECSVKTTHMDEKEMTITLQSSNDLSLRRRTLYTITIPDKSGNWHWYSHLWINPKVKL